MISVYYREISQIGQLPDWVLQITLIYRSKAIFRSVLDRSVPTCILLYWRCKLRMPIIVYYNLSINLAYKFPWSGPHWFAAVDIFIDMLSLLHPHCYHITIYTYTKTFICFISCTPVVQVNIKVSSLDIPRSNGQYNVTHIFYTMFHSDFLFSLILDRCHNPIADWVHFYI